MIVLWALVIILLLHYWWMFTNPKRRILDKTFVNLLRLPIINNLYFAIGTHERIWITFHNLFKKVKYQTFTFWSHECPYVAVIDYKLAKIILSSNTQIEKAIEYRFFESWLGQGIFTAKADRWRKNRKLLNPAFHFQILQKFFQTFASNADILCQKLENHIGKEAFDVYQYVTLCALDNISDTSMGVNLNTQKNGESKYAKAIKEVNDIILRRMYTPWLRYDWLFKYTSTGRLEKKLVRFINDHNEELIKKRKIEFEEKENNNNENLQKNSREKSVFLDLLLEISKDKKLTDEEIRDEVATVMLGGHDTATSAISFLLYSLAEHQDVQEKVYQELEHIFGPTDRCPTYQDVQDMKYTEQVIKETLRFYSVLPAVARYLTEDVPIGDGKYIPKNTNVYVMITAIHRDPEIWPNPDTFDPDRFSPEASQNRHPFAFIPFSAGPRNCIGQKFAMHEIKITVCKILKKFKLLSSEKPEDKIRVKAGPVLTSVNGMRIRVQPR